MECYPNLKIDRSTVSKILKKVDKYQFQDDVAKTTFHHRPVKYPILELAMNMWIERVITKEIIISDSLVKEKAYQFAQAFVIPETTRFKKCNGIRKITMHSKAASALLENLPEEWKKLQKLLLMRSDIWEQWLRYINDDFHDDTDELSSENNSIDEIEELQEELRRRSQRRSQRRPRRKL
ncbi:hypothetical protein Glove_130g96 [Diversispora epigaea]|uniref:HTH CENPB-type domain-containing protein n=1 Tax=Diversispora epigaea TaxID=1348612 RepID=A0A397J7I2_9GLOM|nr:hypothetical protein Glove_130g96 [Diversispora epigaea]